MADFHQPRFVPTIHALGMRPLSTDEVAAHARANGQAITLVLPALAAEVDGVAFPRILRSLSGSPLLDRVIVVLGRGTPDQRRRVESLLEGLLLPVTLVRLDDVAVTRLARHLANAGFDARTTGKGFACWVGISVALASPGSDVIALHDCDIVTYRPEMLTRLVSPLVVPDPPFDFAKGYYARVTSTLYGRVTRLLVSPLLRALQDVVDSSTLPAFLGDFRYPLAGEVAFSRRLAEALPLHGGWGLEMGTLAEVYRRQRSFRVCQVDIADAYEHRHRPLSGTGEGDLTTMTREVVVTLARALRREGVAFDAGTMRHVLAHYRAEAARCLDTFAADAAVNGLDYDRAAEAGMVSAFSLAIEHCLGEGLCADAEQHPSWHEVQRELPRLGAEFAALRASSELVTAGTTARSHEAAWRAGGHVQGSVEVA